MFISPSFKKSLIVEQFQGNYLKCRKIIDLLVLILTCLSRGAPTNIDRDLVGGGGGGRDSHMKQTGMLVVSLRGVEF